MLSHHKSHQNDGGSLIWKEWGCSFDILWNLALEEGYDPKKVGGGVYGRLGDNDHGNNNQGRNIMARWLLSKSRHNGSFKWRRRFGPVSDFDSDVWLPPARTHCTLHILHTLHCIAQYTHWYIYVCRRFHLTQTESTVSAFVHWLPWLIDNSCASISIYLSIHLNEGVVSHSFYSFTT